KPDNGAIGIDRADDSARPEAGSILANPPPFVLEAPLALGRLQRSPGQSTAPVLLGIEGGKMFSDDFVRFIPFEPPGAGIPARDIALRIEHVDGIVLHA